MATMFLSPSSIFFKHPGALRSHVKGWVPTLITLGCTVPAERCSYAAVTLKTVTTELACFTVTSTGVWLACSTTGGTLKRGFLISCTHTLFPRRSDRGRGHTWRPAKETMVASVLAQPRSRRIQNEHGGQRPDRDHTKMAPQTQELGTHVTRRAEV